MTKAEALLKQAEALSEKVESWADLSNALFDPYTGILAKAYRNNKRERTAFIKSTEYKKIRQLITDAKNKFGLAEGATPKPSGKFVIRLPKTLHETLREEAVKEGVSLNQLIVYKLSLNSNLRGKSVNHTT